MIVSSGEQEAVNELFGVRKGIKQEVVEQYYDMGLLNGYNQYKDTLLTPEEVKEKKSQLFFDNEVPNQMTSVGYGETRKPTLLGQNTRWITFNIMQLDLLSRSNPHIRNAIDYLSTLPLINGIDINSPQDQMSSQDLFKINRKFDSLYVSLKDTLSKHYNYGGAASLLWLSHERKEDLKKPLLLSSVKKGSFMGLKPLARWYGVEPAIEKGLISEVGSHVGLENAYYLGTPEYYWVHLVGGLSLETNALAKDRILVHASRIFVFNTEMPSAIETQVERYWGASLSEVMYNSILNDSRLWNATIKSAEKNNMGVLKIRGLGLTGTLNDAVRGRITARLGAIKEASSYNILPIDEQDNFEFAQAALSGQSNVLEISNSRLAGAAGVPVSVMFPDSETEKHEQISLKAITKAQDVQERLLRPVYERLLPIIIKSELGKQVQDVVFTFNPIETQTLKDKASMFLEMTTALENLYNIGLDKASIISMMDDVRKDPINIAQNINAEFREHIMAKAKSGEFETKNSDQILVAQVLNQQNEKGLSGVHNPESDIGGEQGGNKKEQKKPLPRKSLNRDKAKL